MKLLKFLRTIKKSLSRYNPSVEVLISKKNLINNLAEYKRQYPKLSFAPVLKSNAYGHGLIEVAQILDRGNIPFVVVDSLYEAIILRNNGIKSKVLIIGHTRSENVKNAKLPEVSFCVSSLEQLEEIVKALELKIKIHLKIDTGMHRQGILPEEIGKAAEIIKKSEFLELEGICSHFADADDGDFTKSQIKKWNDAVSLFKKEFADIKFFHISATTGVKYSELAHGNVVRLGIGLYGIGFSAQNELSLKPVLEMRSIITSIKTIPKGKCVGYNCVYKTNKTTKIATIPVGYFEGVDRRLFNRGVFQIKNNYCPIVGNVSMNITTIDVSSVPEIKSGDEVVIISGNKSDKNSVENIARMIQTVPHEVLVHIPQHLRRVIIK